MRPIVQNMFPETQTILLRLGTKIKNRRKRMFITQVRLAEKALVSRSTITLIEKGRPGVSMGAYLQIMEMLGMRADLEIIATENVSDYLQLHRLLKGKV